MSKESNFGTAVYLAETHGHDIQEEKIMEVAKILGLYPKVLLKSYKSIVAINTVFNELEMDTIELQIDLTELEIEDLSSGEDYTNGRTVFINGQKITINYTIHNTQEDHHHDYDL